MSFAVYSMTRNRNNDCLLCNTHHLYKPCNRSNLPLQLSYATMQPAKDNHRFFHLSATRVTTLWLICFYSVQKQTKRSLPQTTTHSIGEVYDCSALVLQAWPTGAKREGSSELHIQAVSHCALWCH